MDAGQRGSVAHHLLKRKHGAGLAAEESAQDLGPVSKARLGEPEAQDEEQPQGVEQQLLTDNCRTHLLNLRDKEHDLLAHINHITDVGLAFIDRLRESFQSRMDTIKSEVSRMCDEAEGSLRATSQSTLDLQYKAEMAGKIISKLNIKAADETQADLFSAEEGGSEEAADE